MDWMLNRAIAHRGLHCGTTIPENSLSAFAAAIEQNHPVELDIQLLADGNIVVFHDPDLERMTGRKGAIAHQTLASINALRLLDTNQHIPSLPEVLKFIRGRVPILIEIKNDGKVGTLEAALLKAIQGYTGEFAIQSFNPYSLAWMRKHAPHIIRGQLLCSWKTVQARWVLKIVWDNLFLNWASLPHFIAYEVNALPNLPATIANRVFQCPLLAWTIRNHADQQHALQHADNIIFDTF
ncbi:MAG: glycerophosphodiester phosphodiesterase [Merismopedia sp. SIO2A8]|nr:glycerophosphodiester phosphodiesterase [Merismopedia sp. SIO2A8]